MVNKEQVKRILTELEKIPGGEVSNKKGNIDFDKLSKNKEIRESITKLKKLGVDREYLRKHFFIAGLLFGSFWDNVK